MLEPCQELQDKSEAVPCLLIVEASWPTAPNDREQSVVPVLKPIRVRGVVPKLEVYDNALGPLVGASSAMETVLKINTYYLST